MTSAIALFWAVLFWMLQLSPAKDHTKLAWAIATQAQSRTEAAVMTAVAFRESSFQTGAVGDSGHSLCAFQIYDGPKATLEDVDLCTSIAVRMLRDSRRMDKDNPLAL